MKTYSYCKEKDLDCQMIELTIAGFITFEF